MLLNNKDKQFTDLDKILPSSICKCYHRLWELFSFDKNINLIMPAL